jgi:hypothetical protein
MAGGLIDLIATGCQDLYLTGEPEITLFKSLYKRYTNFSIETIRVCIENEVKFGLKSQVIIPQSGDLVSKLALEIEIPEIYIIKEMNKTDCILFEKKLNEKKKNLKEMKKCIELIEAYMNINIEIYRQIICDYKNSQIKVSDIITQIDNYFFNYRNETAEFKKLILNKFNYMRIIIYYIANNYIYNKKISDYQNKKDLIYILNCGVDYCQELVKYYNFCFFSLKEQIKNFEKKNYKFAWIKRLGHFIIDYIDIYLGSERLDRQTDDWINIWFELAGNKYQNIIYKKMIGDVSELTEYNKEKKKKYLMIVPIPFWFCRNYGLSIPYIALNFSNLSIEFKLKKFSDCCFSDASCEILENLNICININLLIDYIFLGSDERKIFAQCAQEYLIDVIEYMEIDNIKEEKFSFNLEIWNPSKELVWIFCKNDKLYYNYAIHTNGTENPLHSFSLDFNGYSRITEQTGNYFNYVQPWFYHRNTPSDGINSYSFSLKPEEHQPTGHCNFTRISNANAHICLKEEYLKCGNIKMKFFSRSINILRISGGIGSLAYI